MKYILISLLGFMLASCTLSLQNIEKHGAAADSLDVNREAKPIAQPKVSAQAK